MKLRFKILITLVFGILGLQNALAQDALASCPLPGDLNARLEVSSRARVLPDTVMNLRQQPTTSGTLIGQIPAGAVFEVLDGPHCADTFVWWQVHYASLTGWVAEGDPVAQEYWLEPITQPVVQTVINGDFVDSEDCQQPPDDYTRVRVGYAEFNTRTLAMLDYAQQLYEAQGGIANFREAITQGSYAGGAEAASFGTHDGGGAVDLSVRSRVDFSMMTKEIPLMLRALRTAGFAAWLRETDELYSWSPIHIHAIAIGDLELSEAARAQIDGLYGYLRGYDGLPRDDGIPQPDRSGEMVICQWMVAEGFTDLRVEE